MKFLSESVTRAMGRASLSLQKSSPHILFGMGVVGVIGAGVLACRSTLKVEEKVDKIKEDLDAAQNMQRPPATATQEYYKDLAYVGGRAAIEMTKLYGPPVVVGAISIAALSGAHIQLHRRNTALTVTLAAVTKAYSEYRTRVRSVLGDERELDIYRNVHEVEVVTEDGRSTTELVADPNKHSPYARFFDEGSKEWQRNAEHNRCVVKGVQGMVNDQLRARGHIFLNDVYEQLGLSKTTAGQLVGWLWNSENGDNYIDFGLDQPHNSAFMEGLERSVWLDFNVDGPIHTSLGDLSGY